MSTQESRQSSIPPMCGHTPYPGYWDDPLTPLRRAERAIVRALRDAELGPQSQVTRNDGIEIATDDLIVRIERNPDAR